MRSSPDDIDLASLGRAIKKSFPRVALLSLLAGGTTAAVMMTMAPRYTSRATIEIEGRQVKNPREFGRDNQQDAVSPPDKESIGTHVRGLMSTNNTLRMMKDLGLAERPEFNAAVGPEDMFSSILRMLGVGAPKDSETDKDRVFNAYAKAMKIAQIRETRNISIDFTTSDPKFSADGANKLATIYRESLTSSAKTDTADAVVKLRAEASRLEKEVSDADNRVTKFRGERDLFKGNQLQASSLKEQQLGEFMAELTKATAARTEAEARSTSAKEQMLKGVGESNPDVQKSQIIPRLVEQRIRQERQVSELSASLLSGHPRMKQVQNDLASLQRQIKDEVKKVVDGLERDAKVAADKEASLKKRVTDVKGSITVAAPDDAQLKGFEDAAKSKRDELARVKKSLEAAMSVEGTGVAPVAAKIIETAVPSNEKVFPKPGMFAPLVTLAMLLVGLAWSVTKAIVMGPPAAGGGGSDRSGSRMDLEPLATSQTPALVAAPIGNAAMARSAAAKPTAAIARTMTQAPTAAKRVPDIDAAITALLNRDAGGACRSLVTADGALDAATEALSFAKGLAAGGKSVVLVDWSSSASALTDLAGGAPSPGLAQLVQGDVAFEDVIQKLADNEAHFVPAGEALADQSVIFDADRANLVLDAMDEAFEHIVVFADHASARDLFEATQGRFDVGVTVAETAAAPGESNVFLGFDVADMTTHRVMRAPVATASPAGSGQLRRGATRSPTRQTETAVRA